MIPPVKPALAYPDFAAPTATFAPSGWPELTRSPERVERYTAIGRLASGAEARQESTLSEREIELHYRSLTDEEKEGLLGPAGFFETAGGKSFELRAADGTIHTVRFKTSLFTAVQAGHGRWKVSPITLVTLP